MAHHQPFIDDPDDLRQLQGKCYVVLRPTGPVFLAYRRLQSALKARLDGSPVSYPAEPHVTLAGFPAGNLDHIRELVSDWARQVGPLTLAVERVHAFKAPAQIVVVQIRKTPELFTAMSTLRDRAVERQLGLATVTPTSQWIFHMSVAYCSKLAPAEWEATTRFAETLDPEPGSESTVMNAEIAVFQNGREELGGIVQFGG